MHNKQRSFKQPHRSIGLTLIELLVAISVLGVVAVLGWRGLDSIVRARLTLNADLEQTRNMQLTFAQMQSDCTHLADASMMGNHTPILVDQDRLTLIRTVFADAQPTRLQVVTYRLQDGTLTRQESIPTRDLTVLDTEWRSASNDTETETPVVLQSGVKAMTVRLWSDNRWITGTETVQRPPSPQALLSGLEVTLQLREQASGIKKVLLLGAV